MLPEYAAWCDDLPDALQAIVDLDLDALTTIEPPRVLQTSAGVAERAGV